MGVVLGLLRSVSLITRGEVCQYEAAVQAQGGYTATPSPIELAKGCFALQTCVGLGRELWAE
jgi:hypothetical protein